MLAGEATPRHKHHVCQPICKKTCKNSKLLRDYLDQIHSLSISIVCLVNSKIFFRLLQHSLNLEPIKVPELSQLPKLFSGIASTNKSQTPITSCVLSILRLILMFRQNYQFGSSTEAADIIKVFQWRSVDFSSSEAERSFSTLRRLKAWLRSRMSYKRQNHVAVCHVHQVKLNLIQRKLSTICCWL